jgi:uncharacterized protein (TIGR03083 family)
VTPGANARSSAGNGKRAVSALLEEWRQVAQLLEGLSDDQWRQVSILPGWTVHDVVAHIIGTESVLVGEIAPSAKGDLSESGHVHNDIGALNELWVDSMRELSPPEMLERYRAITSTRARSLEPMTEEELDAPSWTPVGQATYGRYMQIRVFDCWIHEQDIRDSVGVPGNDSGEPAEVSMNELSLALGFIVGKKAGAPEGSSVTFEVTGGVRRTFHVKVAGRAALVDHLDAPASVTLRLTSGELFRLAAGRVDPGESVDKVTMEGDTELGRRVVLALPFTM